MKKITTTDDFNEFTKNFWVNKEKPFAFGLGLNIYDLSGENVIAVRWLTINVENNMGTAAIMLSNPGISAATIVELAFEPFIGDGSYHSNIAALQYIGDDVPAFQVYQTEDELLNENVSSIADAHFRLSLISRRHYEPNTIKLDGAFGILPNLVYTSKHAYTIEDYEQSWFMIIDDEGMPICQDRFPPMYWGNPAPTNVRVANTAMIRAGAHLAEKTVVMHYGFVNFNAGTLNNKKGVEHNKGCMIEGTVAGGVTVGDGSDFGARAGALGTMSGGNSVKISVGENSLLGVDSEIGIPIGDNVLIKEGTVFSAGTPFTVVEWKKDEEGKFLTENGKPIVESEKLVKASELSGISNVTFRVGSQNGRHEVLPIPNKVQLNDLLHKND